MDAVKIWGDKMTKDEARKELLETLEAYCHEHGYGLQTFAGLSALVYTLYPLQKTMTKGDWVRSMNDEDLANWLCQISTCSQCGFMDECRTGENGAYNWLMQKYRGRDND